MPTFRPAAAALGLLLVFGAALLSSCGGTGSKQASKYERLTETSWDIALEESSGISLNLFRQRYTRVRLLFEENDGGRTYRITGYFSEDSTAVLAEGSILLQGDDVLQMTSGLRRKGPITWTYEFEASRAIFTVRDGSRAFLRTLFPNTTWSRQAVTMTLAPDDA